MLDGHSEQWRWRWIVPAVLGTVVLAMLGGCGGQPPAVVPRSPTEYRLAKQWHRVSYPRWTIVLDSLQRVTDPTRPEQARKDSLDLLILLDAHEPVVVEELGKVVSSSTTPDRLREATLAYLLKKDEPHLAPVVVSLLPRLDANSPLRADVLDWLARHPQPEVLSEVVRLWALQPGTTGEDEQRFRRVVARMAGRSWDRALLESLNAPSFAAKGDALEVLSRRMAPADLRKSIAALPGRTDEVLAMQAFAVRLGYVPSDTPQLRATVQLYKHRRAALDVVARTVRSWKEKYNYEFCAADFHLLSRLATDPYRKDMSPAMLKQLIGREMRKRKHVNSLAPNRGQWMDASDFWLRHDRLSLGDLWTIYLLMEMLQRASTEKALYVVATRDRADKTRAWGGLIVYLTGRAQAVRYLAANNGRSSDLVYVPGRQMLEDSIDSLCRFTCHFEKVMNASRAGPEPEEVQDARRQHYRGLTLTSLSEDVFCAHYYNERGVVISLGTYPFRRLGD